MLDNVVSPCGDPDPGHVQADCPVCNHADSMPDHHACSIYYIHLSLASSLQGETPASLFSSLQEDGTIFYLPELNTLPVLDEYSIGTNYVFYHILFAVPAHADAHALVDVLTPLGKVYSEFLGVMHEDSVKAATGHFSQFILSSQGQQVEEVISGLSDMMSPLFVMPKETEPTSSVESFCSIPQNVATSATRKVIEPDAVVNTEIAAESASFSGAMAPSVLSEGEVSGLQDDVEETKEDKDAVEDRKAPLEPPLEEELSVVLCQGDVTNGKETSCEDLTQCANLKDSPVDEISDARPVVLPKYQPPIAGFTGHTAKLDTLVSRVSEIAGMQTRLYDYALAQGDDMLRSMADELDHLYGTLRDSALDLRMVALEPLLASLGDWATEYTHAFGKTAAFEIFCEDTRLDSEVADGLLEALAGYFEHILEMDVADNSTGQMSVKISAEHSGADVLLQIEQKGFVHAAYSMDVPDALLALQSAVFALHGAMAVAYSDDQHVVIKINVPITQAMIEGLLVQCGEEQYIVPMNQLSECVDCNPRMGVEAKDNKIVLGGTPVPYLRLREFLGMEVSKVDNEQCLVIQSLSGTFGLIVDGVAEELQTAVKSIGPLYSHIEMFTGASVKPDGTLALVLNMQHLQVVADCLIVGA